MVRQCVQVKLLPQEGKYMCWHKARIVGIRNKRLKELQAMTLRRDQLLLKLGAAKAQYPVIHSVSVAKAGLTAPQFHELRLCQSAVNRFDRKVPAVHQGP